MKTEIHDNVIFNAIERSGFTGRTIDECRLCLLELIVKANAGYHNSHTEESFMKHCDVLKLDRTPNKKGRQFLMNMIYKHSNLRPDAFSLIERFRN